LIEAPLPPPTLVLLIITRLHTSARTQVPMAK
jgi:hypothetical protein